MKQPSRGRRCSEYGGNKFCRNVGILPHQNLVNTAARNLTFPQDNQGQQHSMQVSEYSQFYNS